MTTQRKVIIWVIVLVGLAGVAYTGFRTWLLVLGIDEPCPDDSDLRVTPRDIPEEQNAFHWLKTAADRASVPWEETKAERETAMKKAGEELAKLGLLESDDSEHGEEDAPASATSGAMPTEKEDERERSPSRSEIAEKKLFDVLTGDEWHEGFVQNVLDANGPVFEAWKHAVACRRMQVPWMLSMAEGRRIADRLGKLLRLQGARFIHKGETKAAWELALDMIEVGQQWEGGHGSLPGYWYGQSIKASGISLLEAWAADARPPPARLSETAKRLAGYGANEEGLKYSLRADFMLNTYTLLAMMPGQVTLADIGPLTLGPEGWEPTWPEQRLQPGWTFRPNETKRWMVEWYRALIEQVSEPYCKYSPPWLPPKQKGYLDVLGAGNTHGRMICHALLPSSRDVVPTKCRENAWIAALRALLALQAYWQDAGRLPQQLDQLVPDYLDAVPVDDFDGKPLRYDPEKRIVYSVGRDLKDDGGMTPKEAREWWKETHSWEAEDRPEPDVWDLPDPSWAVEF